MMKKMLVAQNGINHSVAIQFVAAFGAGTICNFVTNPLSVVRSRMLLTDKSKNYASVGQTLVHIAKTEGIRGFYKVSTL
jgi:hypothetical protein